MAVRPLLMWSLAVICWVATPLVTSYTCQPTWASSDPWVALSRAGVSNDDSFLELPCDVLVPCAVDGTVHAGVVDRLGCKVGVVLRYGA